MEFITDITVIIDEADYKDPGRLRFLQSRIPNKKGACYTVRGTYEEIEDLSIKLSAARHHSSLIIHGGIFHQDDAASIHVKSVDVSGVVMAYIVQKCAKEIDKIGGNHFFIVTKPDVSTVKNKPGGTVQVIFIPRHVSVNPVYADFVRKQFITFYQKTASNLQATSVPLGQNNYEELQRGFPQLLFKPSHERCEVTVIGPFVHIAKLKEFLLQIAQSSRKSPVNTSLLDTLTSKTSDPSSTHSKDTEDESCPICMEPIGITDKETLQCKHSFCRNCLIKAFHYKPVCPSCGVLYGTLTGTQPDGGKMNVTKNSSSLPGYEQYGTIIIQYYIPSGIQKEGHPNPGQPFEGASRTAFLPDTLEGRRILKLLERAFDQRLIFTVGQSTTSGRSNMVTWNDIHHKTSTHGGPTHYGYPDPHYLSRVQDELTAKGIV